MLTSAAPLGRLRGGRRWAVSLRTGLVITLERYNRAGAFHRWSGETRNLFFSSFPRRRESSRCHCAIAPNCKWIALARND